MKDYSVIKSLLSEPGASNVIVSILNTIDETIAVGQKFVSVGMPNSESADKMGNFISLLDLKTTTVSQDGVAVLLIFL